MMTEDELLNSYKRSLGTIPYSPNQKFWGVFYIVPLVMLGSLAGICVLESSTPWWIPIIGLILGIILGFWMSLKYGSENPLPGKIVRSLLFFGFYLFFKAFSDFLAWCVIPQEHYHFLFGLGLLLSIGTGWILVFFPAIIRGYRIKG